MCGRYIISCFNGCGHFFSAAKFKESCRFCSHIWGLKTSCKTLGSATILNSIPPASLHKPDVTATLWEDLSGNGLGLYRHCGTSSRTCRQSVHTLYHGAVAIRPYHSESHFQFIVLNYKLPRAQHYQKS